MAQIGYGYGSEFQLQRFLGHHRNELERILSSVIDPGDYYWLDFEYADPKSTISGDKEIMGLSFLEKLYPNQYPAIKKKYEEYKINRRDTWQNWDAIFTHNGVLYLVEAKAHTSELSSGKEEHGEKSKEEILRFFKEQLPNIAVTRDWLKEYYQMANRLATAALLNDNGVRTKVLYIYFVNGYRKRQVEIVSGKDKLYETVNLNASQEQFEEAINTEMEALGFKEDEVSYLLAPPIFINAEPVRKK